MVAVKDRRNGALNPYAHLQQPDITLESVQASPMLWDPVRYDETCPSSDGACAVVIGDEEAALAQRAAGGVDPGDRDADRADDVRGQGPGEPGGRRRGRGRAVAAGRDHVTDRRDRRGRDLRAVLLVRADVAGEPGLRRARRRLAADRGGRDRDRREAAGQPLRRGAVLQPDRRVGPAPVRRGGPAGDGQGGRAPGAGRADRARARLRRRVAVLLDVGGVERGVSCSIPATHLAGGLTGMERVHFYHRGSTEFVRPRS